MGRYVAARSASAAKPHAPLHIMLLPWLALMASHCWGAPGTLPAQPQILAPGYATLAFTPPAPGTYRLPALKPAADGDVLTSDGSQRRLHDIFGDKIVLLSLIYTACSDVNGCPLATTVLHRVKTRLERHPDLLSAIRLVSLSFDPDRDRPEIIRRYSVPFQGGPAEWHFLTTASQKDLAPILSGYGQSIVEERDPEGRLLGTFSHILRVYLIDRAKEVRNIYSISFLHPDTIINDIKTLMIEADHTPTVMAGRELQGSGDDKTGYDSEHYITRSRSIQRRSALSQASNLLGIARDPPLGLPAVPEPESNPLTEGKVALGRKLFFDRRLSINNTFSCAMCHIPEQGFASNELATAVGVEGRTVRRNAPTLYNVAYQKRLFHDARENSLEQQVWSPLLARNEMANPSIGYVIEKLQALPDYEGRFEAAFDGRPPSMETIGMALASYQRTLLSAASPFDRWYYGEDLGALGDSAERGFRLFRGRAGCSGCHLIGSEHALFTDHRLHNTGIGFDAAMGRPPPIRKVQVAPGQYLDVESDVVAAASEQPPSDLGRYEITQDPVDRWRYRTTTLRNVALTPPYMHNGSLRTLREVLDFYNRGGIPNEGLDPKIRPLGLSDDEIQDLVVFLESLTGDNVDTFVADAFAAPVGDSGG